MLVRNTGSHLVNLVGKVPVYRVGGLGSIPLNTQGLKIIEEKVLFLL